MDLHRALFRLRPLLLFCFFGLLLFGTAWSSAQVKKLTSSAPTDLRNGDIVFQSSMAGQGLAIAQATRSPYTHCGIVFIENGRPIVWEAVGPVKRTPWKEFVKHGDGGHYVVKRLREPLDPARMAVIVEAGESMMGRPYDIHFQMDDGNIYCSELVYKMYRATEIEVGDLERFCDMDLEAPIAHQVLVERFGDKVPCDAPVITPASLFRSPLLITVDSVGAPPL